VELTKRQEKRLDKIFNNPKQLRKWVDEVYREMIERSTEEAKEIILEYLDIYSIATAYTLNYVCGLGKKRLPEVMERIWNNVDSFRSGHLSLEDCISELKKAGIDFKTIVKDQERLKKIDIGGKK
jgi:hypothetical protein